MSDKYKSAVADVAFDWSIRRADGLTPEETGDLLTWLAADPQHAQALAEAEKTTVLLRRPRVSGTSAAVIAELNARQAHRRVRRRLAGWSVAGLAAAAVVAFLYVSPGSAPHVMTDRVATVRVRADRQVLPDGSIVDLNAGAEIRVTFAGRDRAVELLSGEALFSVKSDPTRPFVVSAGGVNVHAVGTEFSIRHGPGDIDVLVTEGKVAVAPSQPQPRVATERANRAEAPIYVAAGNRLSVPAANRLAAGLAPRVVSADEIAALLAWRGSRVEFLSTPLREALQLFNSSNQIQIVAADPALESVRVGGIFWKNDPEAFARLLEMSFDLKARHEGTNRIVLTRLP